MKIPPDDPRLTAYVLEELDPAEREAVASEIRQSESLYREAMQVYETASWLKTDLARTAPVGLDAARAAAIRADIAQRGDGQSAAASAGSAASEGPSNIVALPGARWPWAIAGIAVAACLAFAFVVWQRWREQEVQLARIEEALRAPNVEPPQRPAVQPADAGQPANAAPLTPPPGPTAAAPSSAPGPDPAPEVAVAPAPTAPVGDIRMLMRYGLRPRGAGGEPPPAATEQPKAAAPSVGRGAELDAGLRDAYFARSGSFAEPGTAGPTVPGTESYGVIRENRFVATAEEPLSTFGVDVDTASYTLVRRFLNEGRLPPRDAVRIEELINYFPYDYAPPQDSAPFAVHLEVAGCPWNPAHRLLRVGLKAREIASARRPACNLVFLVDVSGSMEPANKLTLLRQSLRLLVERLQPEDTVALVVYAGESRVVLQPVSGDRRTDILEALDSLRAGGSTNGGDGLQTAYALARQRFLAAGVNRVILCTDGDFNVGITDPGDLTRLIEDRARSGVFLSVLGFGVGNLKDSTMERLADRGNGQYAYIDTLNEAHKVLSAQMHGTLVTVAKDVKAQIEFNPARVRAHRLIGYENRALAARDFNDDRRDAGEIGAGHTVTAFYEIEPAGAVDAESRAEVDPLKYQPNARPLRPRPASGELLTLKLRYKEPNGDSSRLLSFPLVDAGRSYGQASSEFKFAASVAAFGLILRDSPQRGTASLAGVLELAEEGLGRDADGFRAEFLTLVRRALQISPGR